MKRWTLFLFALLVGYGIFIGRNFAPVASGADSGGYFNSARLLREGRFTTPMRTVPEYQPEHPGGYVPLGFIDEKPKDGSGGLILKPTYPVGLPLHYAFASLFAGWHWGPLAIGVLAAMAAVGFTYACLREMDVEPPIAFAGAAALAISPMFMFSSFVAMSDTPATAWSVIAVWAALRARSSPRWSLFCGFAYSLAVLVRPTNAILLPALALLLWNWRALLGAFVGGLPGAIWQAYYNRAMYGSALRSGYGSIFDAFGWAEFKPSVQNYVETMPWVLPIVFAAILLLPFCPWRRYWREVTAFLLWTVGFALFYAYYDVTKLAWWYLRFLLPAFPGIVLLGALGLQGLIRRVGTSSYRTAEYTVVGVVCLASLLTSIHWCKLRHVMLMKPYQQPYVIACEWAQKNVPKNALISCMQTSSAFYFYTDFPILRWDQLVGDDRTVLEGVFQKAHRPVYAFLFEFEREDALHGRLPWAWEKVADLKDVTVWRLKE